MGGRGRGREGERERESLTSYSPVAAVHSCPGLSPWPWLSASVACLMVSALHPPTSQTTEREKMSVLAGEGEIRQQIFYNKVIISCRKNSYGHIQ